jgi:hypothetical protein
MRSVCIAESHATVHTTVHTLLSTRYCPHSTVHMRLSAIQSHMSLQNNNFKGNMSPGTTQRTLVFTSTAGEKSFAAAGNRTPSLATIPTELSRMPTRTVKTCGLRRRSRYIRAGHGLDDREIVVTQQERHFTPAAASRPALEPKPQINACRRVFTRE